MSRSLKYRHKTSMGGFAATPHDRARAALEKDRYQECVRIVDAFLGGNAGNLSDLNQRDAHGLLLIKLWALYYMGDYDGVVACIDNSRERGYLHDDKEVDLILLWIDCKLGKYKSVIASAAEFISCRRETLPRLLADYMYVSGYANYHVGNIECAENDLRGAFELFRLFLMLKEASSVAIMLGALCLEQASYVSCMEWFDRSRAIGQQLGSSPMIAKSLLHLGIANYKMGNYSQALKYIVHGLDVFVSFRLPLDQVRAELALSHVFLRQGMWKEAHNRAARAYSVALRERWRREEVIALEYLGDVQSATGNGGRATQYFDRGLQLAERIAPEGDLIVELKRRMGERLMLSGKPTQALPILAQARTLAKKLGDRFEEGAIVRGMGVASARIRDWKNARRYLGEAIALQDEIGAKHELAISHLEAARVFMAQAEAHSHDERPGVLLEDAWDQALAAHHLFLKLGIEHWLKQAKEVLDELVKLRGQVLPAQEGAATADGGEGPTRILAVSSAMRGALELCKAYARYSEPILITGETGTGKELVARRIHEQSLRHAGPLVAVNVAAIPASMFEREFFGHCRGAFTGATEDGPGYVGAADGGTLFLDEIGDLPLEQQPKLLRLLQEGTYMALGDPRIRQADIRLLAATNANLKDLVDAGKFRQDLYYRLRVLDIDVPPLRKRREDIVPLLNHFLSQAVGRPTTISEYFDEPSIAAMRRYHWPGNVREVIMVARRAQILMAAEGNVRIELGPEPQGLLLTGPGRLASESTGKSSEDDILRSRILVIMEETGQNKSETARRLGVSRPTLYRWMERLGVSS
jgi:DNA-binding NtrC family response regulator